MKRRFIFLNSHPIQYFAPLYAEMTRDNNLEITVLYCSRQNVDATQPDRQFGIRMAWDIPMLEGYRHVFLKNYAPRPSLYSFWGLQNWGLVAYLWRSPKSVLVVNGWQFLINFVAVIAGKLLGHTICMRGESPLGLEMKKTQKALLFRRVALGKMLFGFVDHFLYLGEQNKRFYQLYQVPESRLTPSPYSVDNQRFQAFLPKSDQEKQVLRKKLGLPENHVIILFSGKYIAKKRPLDLLRASLALQMGKCTVVMLGEGELRPEMEQFILENEVQNVILTGFVNQAEIPLYYAAADIFVMCSDVRETWGLAVNEAMNLALPVVVSDEVGCSDDLVEPGINGFIYPAGDIGALAEKLSILVNDEQLRKKFGQRSLQIIGRYSYTKVIRHLKNLPTP